MKSSARAAVWFALIVGLGSGAAALAQENVTVTPALAPMTPVEFAKFVWRGNQQEVVDARYVLANSKNPVVRAFAQGMLGDEATANVELRVAGRSAAVEVPATEPPVSDAIKGLTGGKLDSAYMESQYYSLQQASEFMQRAATNATSPAFKSYANVWQEYFNNHITVARWYHQGVVNTGVPPSTLPDPSSRTGLDFSSGPSH